jgi:hypothetical protein
MALLLALCAALASAFGNVIRQRSAQEITDKPVGHLALFRKSLGGTRWWLGGAGAVANYGLLAAALGMGSVMLVTALLFALPIYARVTRHRVTRWEGTWAALLAVALAAFITIGHPEAGRSRRSLTTWIVVAVVMVPLSVLCLGRTDLAGSPAFGGAAGDGGRFLIGGVRGADEGRCQCTRRRFRCTAPCARTVCLDINRTGRSSRPGLWPAARPPQ